MTLESFNECKNKRSRCFNPFSKEFKQAQKVFYEDLSDRKRIIAVFAAVIGGAFFIVGGFATFCWTVRALQPSDKSSRDSKKVTQSISSVLPTVKSISVVPPAENVKKKDFSDCCIVEGLRFNHDLFDKFKEALQKNDLNFNHYAGSDPGPGQRVIVFEFWGRKGGEINLPFSDDFEASILYVIVGPNQPIMPTSQSKNVEVLFLKWDPDDPFNKLDATNLKEFLKQSSP